MFNPYQCRPIGSSRFEEHLRDVQTSRWYATESPVKPDDIPRICETAHVPWWEENPKDDPWTNLAWAIAISAFIEYLEVYAKKIKLHPGVDKKLLAHEGRCFLLENYYFREDPTLENLFDKMLVHVCWKGVAEIKRCRRQLMQIIGWMKKPDTTRETRAELAAEKQAAEEERYRKLFARPEEDFPEDDFGIGDLNVGYRYDPYDRNSRKRKEGKNGKKYSHRGKAR